jgi:hypothetical protein
MSYFSDLDLSRTADSAPTYVPTGKAARGAANATRIRETMARYRKIDAELAKLNKRVAQPNEAGADVHLIIDGVDVFVYACEVA